MRCRACSTGRSTRSSCAPAIGKTRSGRCPERPRGGSGNILALRLARSTPPPLDLVATTQSEATMLTRRALAKLVGAAALSGGLPFGPATQAFAQGAAGPSRRGAYLIKNGAVVTVDAALGTLPRADVLVRDGSIAGIGPDLAAADAEVIDATDMIVMPGFVDTHYHMWSALGRNFTATMASAISRPRMRPRSSTVRMT